LNTMEMDWLETMSWKLYINLDESQDYQQWLQSWKDWSEEKKAQRKATLDRLAPLDTNVQRPRPTYPTVPQYTPQQYTPYPKSASRERPLSGYRPAYEQPSWKNSYPTPHTTPPSAPDSGVTTPEYLSATGGNQWPLYNPFSRSYGSTGTCSYVAIQSAPWATPEFHYGHPYGLSPMWEANVGCTCTYCMPHLNQKQSMFINPHGYGRQIAA
jgi:hypothetical protein